VTPLPADTLADLESRRQDLHGLWGRRVVMTALALLVAVGSAGWLGVRAATTSASGAGWDLEVEHAAVARAGLDVPFRVTVTHPGGFDDDIVLSVTGAYLDLHESQAFHPEPSDSTRDADSLQLTFAAPVGDTFVLTYDAYLQPAAQLGGPADVSVLVGGEPVATASFSTTVLP
jgi:hypothetical protein